MVKSSIAASVAFVAFSAQAVMGQSSLPTDLDPATYSSLLGNIQKSLQAMATNPSYSSLMANPTFSSYLAEASNTLNAAQGNPAGASPSGNAGSSTKPSNSASNMKPIGAAALAISAAVAVGML